MKRLWGMIPISALLLLCIASISCRSTYYSAWEKFGKHKRDLLKDHVEAARDDQKAAAEQFKDALTRLKELYGFEGGDLEKTYGQLQGEYDRCAAKAKSVRNRIEKVEQIASDLFKEWDDEIRSMTNERLAAQSRDKLAETRNKFRSLQAAMKKAEASMEPVLGQFRDYVLYLKHSVNAQAVGALKKEALDIEKEIQELIRAMNASISAANDFIKGF
jgi:hypothetical protein